MRQAHDKAVLAILVSLIGLGILAGGCGGISPEAKQLLINAAASAKARAEAFAKLAPSLKTLPEKQAALDKFIASHVAGLASDATDLADLNDHVQAGHSLSKAAKVTLGNLATNSKGRAENWDAIRGALTSLGMPNDDWQKLSGEHLAALQDLATKLAALWEQVRDRKESTNATN